MRESESRKTIEIEKPRGSVESMEIIVNCQSSRETLLVIRNTGMMISKLLRCCERTDEPKSQHCCSREKYRVIEFQLLRGRCNTKWQNPINFGYQVSKVEDKRRKTIF